MDPSKMPVDVDLADHDRIALDAVTSSKPEGGAIPAGEDAREAELERQRASLLEQMDAIPRVAPVGAPADAA